MLTTLFSLLLQSQAPAVPATVHDPGYPLRVQLAQTGASSGTFNHLTAYGHGNLLGPPVEGFDFSAACNQRFAPRPEENQFFPARWKKQDLSLEILIHEFGSKRITPCELKLVLRDQPYELSPAGSFPRLMQTLTRSVVPVTEPDSNFPLRLQLWIRTMGASSQLGAHAEGYGNILGPPLAGFDFGNTCPVRFPFARNTSDVYQARWLEQGLQLEVLLQELGTRQQSVCVFEVGMKAQPYPAPQPGQRPVPPARDPRPKSPQAPTSNSDLPPPEW